MWVASIWDSLTTLMTGYLEEHNAISTKPLRLVLFRFAIEHLSRVSRVIKLPGGHTLLVGVGGSGRQSLTRLAAYMAEFEVMSIELSKGYGVPEWREDLKALMMKAGAEGKPTVFLFNVDTQLQDEHFLEDISNLLNTGNVPNLFPADEKMAAVETVRARAKQLQASGRFHHRGKSIDTTDGAWELFLNSAKENLHIVLCLSPAGSNMRERLRSFPSLVNCCTIDWFTAWPAEALEAVAVHQMRAIDDLPHKVRAACVAMCMHFHADTLRVAGAFFAKLRRRTYVTPTSYLELLSTFKTLLRDRRAAVSSQRERYVTGLEKLESTGSAVADMQRQLEDLKPVLIQTTIDTDEMIKVVNEGKAEAEVIAKDVGAAEEVAKAKAAISQGIKEECEGDLAKAMPMLHKALKALDTLQKSDIVEVKSMKSPPGGVRIVMQARKNCLYAAGQVREAQVYGG